MGQTAVIPAQIVDVAARSLLGNNTASADAAQTISFSTASTGHVLTVQGDGSVAFAAVSAGIGGSTGSTDNAVLRADGTAGDTLQDSGWIIPDIYTASPNATVNHASIQATGNTTNVSVSVVPKGTGSFSLQVPDGTAVGGNARGANAVDFSTSRGAATNVASGASAFIGSATSSTASGSNSAVVSGVSCTASGTQSFVGTGFNNTATSTGAAVLAGSNNTASAQGAFIGAGTGNTASGIYSLVPGGEQNTASSTFAMASGLQALANRHSQRSHAGGQFSAKGDCQLGEIVLRGITTTNSAVRLRPDGSSQRLTIASGQVCQYLLIVTGVRNGGADVASYMRQVTIKNIGGTTSLVGTVNTIGTDEAAGTSLSVTADDTNDDLAVEPTGVSGQTWRWECVVYGGEIGHG